MVGFNGKDLVGGVFRLGVLGYLFVNFRLYKFFMWVEIREVLFVLGFRFSLKFFFFCGFRIFLSF